MKSKSLKKVLALSVPTIIAGVLISSQVLALTPGQGEVNFYNFSLGKSICVAPAGHIPMFITGAGDGSWSPNSLYLSNVRVYEVPNSDTTCAGLGTASNGIKQIWPKDSTQGGDVYSYAYAHAHGLKAELTCLGSQDKDKCQRG